MSTSKRNELTESKQEDRLEKFAGEEKHEPKGEIESTLQKGLDSTPQAECFPELQVELNPETKEKKSEMGSVAAPPRFVLAREEAHCYLQLQFPLLLFTDHVPEGMNKLSFDEGQIPPLPWLKAARGALERFEAEIRRYFHPDASVPELLFPLLPLKGHELADWLSALGHLDMGALRQTLLQGVLPLQEQLSKKPHELSAIAAEDARRFLQQTRLPADACWMIYALLDDLDKIAPELQHLFAELRFLSDAMINPMETDAIVAVDKLLKRFNTQDSRQKNDMAAEAPELPLKAKTPDPWLRRLFSEQELRLLLQQDSITVYPSLIPWDARLLPGGRSLVLGYALAALLTREEEAEKSEEMEQQNFCKLLSDPTRFKLCKLLAEESARPVDLARRLEISQATVSHHLSALRDLGLLKEKRGKKELSKERAAEILQSLLQQFA